MTSRPAGSLADHEPHDPGPDADREDPVRPLTVVRVDPALSIRLAAERHVLDRVAVAFAGKEPVLFQFGERPGERFDPATAIATWLHRLPASWFAVETARLADAGHPYNLARRIASLDQLSGGRTAWVVSEPGSGDAHRDYLRVVSQLWRSWPRESIAADASAEHFAETEGIRRIGAEGTYRVAGPLNVPSSPQHLPVVVALDEARDDPHRHVDLLLRGDSWALPGSAGREVAVVRSAEDAEGLLAIARRLGPAGEHPARTLRERLRLPVPELSELPGAGPRFPRGSETEAS
ncbi:hypothetical protein [Microbacterium tumbae]